MSETESRSIEDLQVDFQNSINSIDTGPTIDALYEDRVARNVEAMKKIDATIITQMVESSDKVSVSEKPEEKAAVIIQSYFRGYLARVKYVNLLYEHYEKEEAARLVKTTEQVNETDILVENNRLSIDIEDLTTEVKNRNLRRINDIIIIQRWWRNIRKRRKRVELKITQEDSVEETNPQPDLVNNNGLSDQADCVIEEENANSEHESTEENVSSDGDVSSEKRSTENARSSPSRESIRDQIKNSRGSPLLNKRLLASKYNKSVKETHREDVRKRLAMSLMNNSESERYVRTSSAGSLQVYMNDLSSDQQVDEPTQTKREPTDIHTKQIQLYEEATHAYAQAGPMAKRLFQVKKMSEEPSEIAKMLGITSFGRVGEITLSKTKLNTLSIDQLHIVYNAIRNEIDRYNDELVDLVVVKDELHMQKDSLLLNIEDLKERIEEKQENSFFPQKQSEEKTAEQNKRTGPLSKLNKLLKFKST